MLSFKISGPQQHNCCRSAGTDIVVKLRLRCAAVHRWKARRPLLPGWRVRVRRWEKGRVH